MLFTSPVYSQASGSIAGITYSHNRGGMYTRARVTPTDPSTALQQIMRAAMGVLAPYWGNTLTPAERDAWRLYADNVPWTNPLGQSIFLTGQQHFLRTNTVRIQFGEAILDAAPTVFDLGTFTPPTFTAATDGPTADITFDNTDPWANGTGGFMYIFTGKSVGSGRAFYRGPWRKSDKVVGDAIPPASPITAVPQWPWAAGNLAWVVIRVIQIDGRMSLPVILGPRTVT
jgi:hypothetical protein